MADMVTVNQLKKSTEKTAGLVVDVFSTMANRLQKKADSSNAGIMKLYTEAGENVDGTMTQKAIKEALDNYVGETEFFINDLPAQSGKLTYNGSEQSPTWLNYDPLKLNIGGVYENQSAPGTYTTTFTPFGRYTWSNGTKETISRTWKIDKADGTFTLSADSDTVNINATTSFIINRVGNYSGNIRVSSTDSDTASVALNGNSAVVTGKKVGSATIYVNIDSDTNYNAATDTKYFYVNVTSIPISLNATMGVSSVTYNTTGLINVAGNYGEGKLGATSTNTAFVTVENTTKDTVTVKNVGCTSDTVRVNISAPANGAYSSDTTYFDVSTSKAAGSLELSDYSGTVPIDSTSTFTVNRTGNGQISYSVANSDVATASLSGNTITITGKSAGTTSITVKVDTGTNHTAPTDKTFNVTVDKLDVNLSTSTNVSAVTYSTTATYSITGNLSGGTIGATSTNTSYVTVQSTTSSTVVVKCIKYSSTPISVNIEIAGNNKYKKATTSLNVATAKADCTLTLSAVSGSVTFGNTTSFNITANSSGGTLSVDSDAYVAPTLSGSTVTLTPTNCSSSPRTITIRSKDTTGNFNDKAVTFSATLNKAAGSVTLSATGLSNNSLPIRRGDSSTITYSNATGSVDNPSTSNSGVATVAKSGTNGITISGVNTGSANISIPIAASDNYAATSVTVAVTVSYGLNIFDIEECNTLDKLRTVIRNGQAKNYLKVGDWFPVQFSDNAPLIGGSSIPKDTTYKAVLIGIDHNSGYEGINRCHFCLPRVGDVDATFESSKMDADDNDNTYGNSDAYPDLMGILLGNAWNNTKLINYLPNEYNSNISTFVKSMYVPAYNWYSPLEGKFFLLSEIEVFGTATYSYNVLTGRERQYEYFQNGNSPKRNNKAWWLRSPVKDNTTSFCYVNSNGTISTDGLPKDKSFGVVPCFIIGYNSSSTSASEGLEGWSSEIDY